MFFVQNIKIAPFLSALAVTGADGVPVCVRHHRAKRKRPGWAERGGGILPEFGFHVVVGWSQSPLIFGTIEGDDPDDDMENSLHTGFIQAIAIDPVALHQ